MQVLGSRRGGLITLAVAAVALIAAVAFAVWQLIERPAVTEPLPGPGSAVSDARPRIAFTVPADERLGDLRVLLDGKDVTARVRGGGEQAALRPAAKLPEGEHQVEVRFSTGNVFARTVTREWTFTDEWYNLTPYPSFVKVLAEVDAETSIRPEGTQGHPGHGKHHPVSWCHYYDGGRAWLTTLGHDVKAWTDESLRGDTEFREHVVQGTLSAMGVEKFCR